MVVSPDFSTISTLPTHVQIARFRARGRMSSRLGVTLMVAVVVLLINLLVDILYAYVDPQIRYQRM